MLKTASLTSGLVSKKGHASPTLSPEASPATAKNPSADYYKALTVKLDKKRYETLKIMGVKLDKKSQEMFVEALDLYLEYLAKQQ